MKKILYPAAILLFFSGALYAGFSIGMTGAVKNKVKELDQKVTEYKAAHSAAALTVKGSFSGASAIARLASGRTVNRVALVTPATFRVENIGGSNFSVDVGREKGMPLGLIFIDSAGGMAGCLQTVVNSTDTLSLLPLMKLKDGTQEIDLSTIQFSTDTYGNIAVPSYDPVDASREIPLTPAEKSSATRMSRIMAAIFKNADVNGNGIVDFLEGKYFRLCFQYHLKAGTIPAGASDGQFDATVFAASALNGFYTRCLEYPANFNWDNTFPVTFPDGSTGTTGSTGYTQNTNGPGGGTTIPADGTYTVNASGIGAGTLTFKVYGQADAVENLIIPFPTYHVTNGKLTSITWKWKLRSDITGPDIDPLVFISGLHIQVNRTGGSVTRVYNSDGGNDAEYKWSGQQLTGAEGTHTIGVSNLAWPADCGRIDFAYNDKFGNHVVVQFER